MNIAILGWGTQGRSAYDYWKSDDNHITVCDINTSLDLPENVGSKLGHDYLQDLDEFDMIVRSPIVHPRDIVLANSLETLEKVTSNTNEFMRVCPSRNMIGVTGTKGKGTTSTLIAHMLEAAGKRVHLGGNIGIPPLQLLKDDIKPDDWVVLELANFQLIDLKQSPMIAVCLMVVPEHLDWHEDMAEYAAAKQQLFVWQTPDDIAIYYPESEYSRTIAEAGLGSKIPYMKAPGAEIVDGTVQIGGLEICRVQDIKLLGEHNHQNICAAVTAAWQVVHNAEALEQTISSFSGLEHRLELVREHDDIKYYDDSFGTTPETAIVAIQAFSRPKVVILGGSDKGAEYVELAHTVAERDVRKVVVIGHTAPRIKQALQDAGYDNIVDGGKTMESIVAAAREAAEPGDVVLLSTACASFDMFANYKDRGEQFKAAVKALK